MLGGTLSIPPLTLLVTGMVVISVFWLGWAMLRGGLRRAKRRRVEAKEAAAAAEAAPREVEEQKRLQEEFAAREQALAEERRLREQARPRRWPSTTATTTDHGPTHHATPTRADRPASRGDRGRRLGDRGRPTDDPRATGADDARAHEPTATV